VHLREPSLKEQGTLFPLIPFLRRRYWIALCAVAAVYAALASGIPGMSVTAARQALVWPPAGIGIAVILLLGPRATPALLVGSLAATTLTGMPIWASLTTALGVVLEALSGAYLLRNATDFRGDLGRVNDILLFLLFGVGIASMIGATVGTVASCAGGAVPWPEAGRLWRIWWLGDAMGTLIVGSLLLSGSNGTGHSPGSQKSQASSRSSHSSSRSSMEACSILILSLRSPSLPSPL
jgi:integral membrane sensor domain MASE1